MEYIVVAFRSRAVVVGFSNFLKNIGVKNEIVNTPKEAGVGCGLSVKISPSALAVAKRAISQKNLNVAGFFSVKLIGGRRYVRSI